MKSEESETDIFDQYIWGTLPSNELIQFENQLKNDEALKKKFNDYRISVLAINLSALRSEVAGIFIENDNNLNVFQKKIVWMPLAASLALFLTFYYWLKPRANDEVILFHSYYIPYPNIVTVRSKENRMSLAMQAYSNGDYKKALQLFKETPTYNDTILFYKGLSHLSLIQLDSSIAYLEKIDSKSIFSQQVNWYMGLAFLLKKDRLAADYFSKIEPDEFNYSKAEEILELLKKNRKTSSN